MKDENTEVVRFRRAFDAVAGSLDDAGSGRASGADRLLDIDLLIFSCEGSHELDAAVAAARTWH